MTSAAKTIHGMLPQIALALVAVLVAAPAVHADVIDDAKAYWTFSSDFSDSSGNHEGTGMTTYTTGGPEIKTAPAGYSGANALYLRGLGASIPGDTVYYREADYIDFGGMDLSAALTVSAWIRPEASYAVVLGDVGNRYWLRVKTNEVNFKANSTAVALATDPDFTLNEWQHFVLTRDAAGSLTVYRNADRIVTPATKAGTFNPEYIGAKFGSSNASAFKGYMADVGVWDDVLDADQIGQLYLRGADPTADALAFWTFDSDFSNSGTAGSTLDGIAQTDSTSFTVTDESIVGSGALKLRGSTAKDYLQIGDDGAGAPVGLSLDDEMTIAVWLNPEALGSAGGTFLGGTNSDWIRIYSDKVNVRFGSTGNNWIPETDAFEAGTWQHFMLTRDASNNVTLYRNLEEIASGTLTGTFKPLYVGLKGPKATYPSYYRGLMDDFGIWDRVLSPLEMQALFNRVPEPGSATLLLCGAIAAFLWRRRRR